MKLGIGLYRHMLTEENFQFARQCGCTHVIIHLAEYYKDEIVTATDERKNYGVSRQHDPVWQYENMVCIREKAKKYGLTVYGIENFAPADWYDVLLDGPKRGAQMAYLKEIIRNTGKAGIRAFGYNFSIAGVWGHQKKKAARGGAESNSFYAEELPLEAKIPAGQVWNMTYEEGKEGEYLGEITAEQLWDRLKRFLDEMLPVAEEAGVELALHPDDPPMPMLRGTPRLVYEQQLYQDVIKLNTSRASKLEFCMGSIQEMKGSDIYAALEQYALAERISYIHFRNVRGKVPHYDEVFLDEGDIDMIKALRILKRSRFDGVLIPDHTPGMSCEGSWYAGMAFALGYMRAAMRCVEEERDG